MPWDNDLGRTKYKMKHSQQMDMAFDYGVNFFDTAELIQFHQAKRHREKLAVLYQDGLNLKIIEIK